MVTGMGGRLLVPKRMNRLSSLVFTTLRREALLRCQPAKYNTDWVNRKYLLVGVVPFKALTPALVDILDQSGGMSGCFIIIRVHT